MFWDILRNIGVVVIVGMVAGVLGYALGLSSAHPDTVEAWMDGHGWTP
jgi:hypothetical protein